MGSINIHPIIKLVIGLIFSEKNILSKTQDILIKRFGNIDFKSGVLPFIHTTYYEKELGQDQKRIFLSFNKLISLEDLPKIKIYTNKLEKRLSWAGKRQINIDPGYIEASKLVLLSTKDYSHRIYLRYGIYAEVTLFFKDKTFQPWPWTYPDYRTDAYINIFNSIRDIYLIQLKNLR